MAEDTKIEWATHTFNPWVGCTKVSPGCDHCYAEALMDKRYHRVEWGPHGERKRTSEANWRQPLQWARKARAAAEVWLNTDTVTINGKLITPPHRPRVFCSSLADVFDNQVPQEWRLDLFTLICATSELDWLLLTKRPQNIRKMLPGRWDAALPDNIWLGVTAENQEEYVRRLPLLPKARVHFVSYEPALGPLHIHGGLYPTMIICGGEDKARPGRPTNEEFLGWARILRDECRAAGVKFFFKQTVGKGEIPADLMIREMPEVR